VLRGLVLVGLLRGGVVGLGVVEGRVGGLVVGEGGAVVVAVEDVELEEEEEEEGAEVVEGGVEAAVGRGGW
jgi:hypothetical protein